jgi:hypothetical protein
MVDVGKVTCISAGSTQRVLCEMGDSVRAILVCSRGMEIGGSGLS